MQRSAVHSIAWLDVMSLCDGECQMYFHQYTGATNAPAKTMARAHITRLSPFRAVFLET